MRLFIVGLGLLVAVGGLSAATPEESLGERVARLVKQLGHDKFAQREEATRELDAIGEPALGALRQAMATGDAETRRRAELLVDAILGRLRAAAAKEELARLQGTWYTVSTSNRGTESGEDRSDTITYEGSDWFQRRGGRVLAAGTIVIVDALARPKQIEYTYTHGLPGLPQVRSIYSLVGDEHQLCTSEGGKLPTEFSGKAGFLRITRREKNGPAELQLDGDLLPTELRLAESRAAVRRIQFKVRPADGCAGTLTLDPNAPKLDAFGDPAGHGKLLTVEKLPFTLKFVRKGDGRRLYEVRGPKLESRLSLLIFHDLTSAGDARLLVHGKDGEVRYAIGLRQPREPERFPIPCHPGCFPAGTPVRTPDGTKAIERIREGDLITAVDADGKPSPVKVTGRFRTRNRVLEVRTDAGPLVTTTTQPVALVAGGFRAAGELKVGDRVWRWADGKRRAVAVTAVGPANREVEVFNLILGEAKAFIAGDFLVRAKPPAPVAPP